MLVWEMLYLRNVSRFSERFLIGKNIFGGRYELGEKLIYQYQILIYIGNYGEYVNKIEFVN